MHRVLERQLQRCFGSSDAAPAVMQPFTKLVEATYRAFDEDRSLGERSLEQASNELTRQNNQLRLQNEQLQRAHDQLQLAKIMEGERQQLQASVEAMRRVLSLVGHELRTPVAGMRAMADFLLADGAQQIDEWKRCVRHIQQQTARLSDTLNDLLEVTLVNSGLAQWNWSNFGLSEACCAAMDSVRPLVDENLVEFVLDINPYDLTMMGDSGAIRRLLVNLLANAIKYTRQGHIAVRARVCNDCLGERGEWVNLAVEDTGSGILPAVMDKLGKAFALNSGYTGNAHVSGAGLGLAICRGIIAAHGGTLAVKSQAGKGSSFTAHLRRDLHGPVDQTPNATTPIAVELEAA
jgi:signal transduction histidine kinase